MAKMKAAMAAVLVMEKEGVTQAFGVPGAAINPLYAQLRERGIAHILARHVEGASTWPRATPAPRPATSACASAPRARPAPT
jgi:glyoxylate carboligase